MNRLRDLRGQKIALHMLETYLHAPLPGLLILYGPEGTGKWSAAEAFIQQRFCEVRSACGQCANCRKVLRGEHADFIRFPAEKVQIGEEKDPEMFTIRWLLQTRLKYTPFDGDLRFVLFPRADLILHEAETALLKTLEEPPEHTKFIFIVRDLSELKPTIVSRGVLIPFQLIPMKEIQPLLPPGLDARLTGGSFAHAAFLAGPEFRVLREKTAGALGHPLALLEFERWLESGEAKDICKKAELDETALLDHVGMIVLAESEKSAQRRAVADAVFFLKEELHREMPGVESYAVRRFFHQLGESLFPQR